MVRSLGDPPPRLPSGPPSWTWTVRRRRALVRIYHRHPARPSLQARTFGPLGRFDPHIPGRGGVPRESADGRGVLYFADGLATALAEAFPEQWPEVAICPNSRAVFARPERAPVPLLDLMRAGALRIGAVGTLAWGDEPRARTQRWARQIYEQYADLDGIRYAGAHEGGMCVALWERAAPLVAVAHGDLALWTVWSRVLVALADQGRVPVRRAAPDCPQCVAAAAAIM